MSAPTPPTVTLADLQKHRADFAAALDHAMKREAQAKLEVQRMSGAVASLDVVIAKLTAPPVAPKPGEGGSPQAAGANMEAVP